MVGGHGDPDTSPDYATAVQVRYAFAYPLKFATPWVGAGPPPGKGQG